MHRLEAEYWGQVDFIYLDREASDNSEVIRRFAVQGQPVFIFLDADGNEVQRWFGDVDPALIRAALDAYLAG